MRHALLVHLAACVVIAASTLSLSEPARAAPLGAVPETVRVNIALYGTSYALIGSTGAMTATTEDGRVLYTGGQRMVARRNVQRIEGEPVTLPPARAGLTSTERASRLQLVREARRAAREAQTSGKLVTIPFEVSLLAGSDDALGTPVLSASRIGVVRFVAEFGYLNFEGRLFRGMLEVTTDDEGDMIVVNQVETGRYLASVTGAESPATWHGEALAAQAIAARTYLVTHLGRHDNYDLEGDVRDQEYAGIGTEAASAIRAVERTAGIVATYRGAPIEALYSANAGGMTEDSENVYANALPYLRSVPSPGDELAKDSGWGKTSWEWNREFTAPQLGDYLRSRGINVGVPRRIDLVRVTSAGRVTLARVVGTAGTRDIGKDVTRYYFGLKSSLFTVELTEGGETEWVSWRDTARLVDMGILGSELLGTTYERSLNEERELTSIRVTGHVYKLPPRFIFWGRGFGHGVGMSQWGAQGMALNGANYEQILKHYYRGIVLTHIGGA
ncbi:MAG TPA: SpoIID/LytB domain-containing protein [Candidatus Limnocylindria bacterium]|nr:SpoIID/LytB domain-containing protein [Candidatus Limnocylindria bacterium]